MQIYGATQLTPNDPAGNRESRVATGAWLPELQLRLPNLTPPSREWKRAEQRATLRARISTRTAALSASQVAIRTLRPRRPPRRQRCQTMRLPPTEGARGRDAHSPPLRSH